MSEMSNFMVGGAGRHSFGSSFEFDGPEPSDEIFLKKVKLVHQGTLDQRHPRKQLSHKTAKLTYIKHLTWRFIEGVQFEEWISSSGIKVPKVRVRVTAAANGHLALVEWLHANRTKGFGGFGKTAMDKAAGAGHLSVVKWLHANRSEGCTKKAMDGAAGAGHLDVVEWLHANRTEGCTSKAMNKAAEGGHLAMLEWLHVSRSEVRFNNAMHCAAVRGHRNVVNWLLQAQFPFSKRKKHLRQSYWKKRLQQR
ncbi:unnamed protein product [Heterosigma akashiwo]